VRQNLAITVGLVFSLGLLMGASCSKHERDTRDDYDGVGTALDNTAPPDDTDTSAEVPGVDVSKLGDREKQRFGKLINRLQSPCAKPHSLRKSLTTDESCKRAPFAARYVRTLVEEDEDDLTVRALYDARYRNPKRVDVDVAGSAKSGAASPRVTIIEFFDYGCPHCAAFRSVLDEIVEAYPDDVAVYYKNFPLSGNPNSIPAARAAIAADRQGKFHAMHTMLLGNQEQQSVKDILVYAERIGLDMAKFQVDFNDKDVEAMIARDKQQGIDAGVEGTPTLYLNGREYSDPLGAPFLKDWIDEELAVNR
jgi:protein-disulfide isomerase